MAAPIREAALYGILERLGQIDPEEVRELVADHFPQIRWTEKQKEVFAEHYEKNLSRAKKPLQDSLRVKGYDV